MKAHSQELLHRAVAAMVAALEVYNKPDFRYRAESFTILALNAWELLLKAKWLVMHNNRLSSLYVRQGGGSKRPHYKPPCSGSPRDYDGLAWSAEGVLPGVGPSELWRHATLEAAVFLHFGKAAGGKITPPRRCIRFRRRCCRGGRCGRRRCGCPHRHLPRTRPASARKSR